VGSVCAVLPGVLRGALLLKQRVSCEAAVLITSQNSKRGRL
jgi:hypothetical protein